MESENLRAGVWMRNEQSSSLDEINRLIESKLRRVPEQNPCPIVLT